MEEIKALFSAIWFGLYEKIELRSYQGQSSPRHPGDSKRNEAFYQKLEKQILPVLEAMGFAKKRKRIFIRENSDSISYLNLGLNKKLNGICIDYGEISKDRLKKSEKSVFDLIKIDTNFRRVAPHFWKYDYQYPVRKTDKYDELIIQEIVELLVEQLKN